MTWHPTPPSPAWHPPSKRAYTSWFLRACACLLDLIPVAIAAALWEAVALGASGIDCVTYANGGRACTSTGSGAGDAAFVAFAVLTLAYALLTYGYLQGVKGSTMGKWALGFQVVSEKSWRPIGFALSIVRQLAHVVDAAICFVGYLFPLWDAKRQTLADKLVGTVCVPIRPAGAVSGRR
jgi:uncharacterized RDD family membrane protein YckC